MSFLAAGSGSPAVGDLEGLLAGPGQVVFRDDAARLSVVVADPWRADALLAEFAQRGLGGEIVTGTAGELSARTAFDPVLRPTASRWARGSVKAPPPGFRLDGARLRTWALAAGITDSVGYVLRLGPSDVAVWRPMGVALRAAGLSGTYVGPRARGPGYRLVGGRRLARLREFVGEPPPGAPISDWPA